MRGAASANPHELVQEYLNRSPDSLWAVVSNGLCLRILRDNQALSRQSYLGFDLEAMFSGEVYSDFVLLWMTAHASRCRPREGERPDACRLERWTKLAQEQGTRALGDLRGGVEKALQILGEGFTGHPKNTLLRDALRTGQIAPSDFHGQLLRIIYRLIFMFVAEDRILDGLPLLHPRDESPLARQRYAAHYGTARLREMVAKIKGSRHGDLWSQFQLPVDALSGDANSENIRKHMALPALGSFLWNPVNTASLNDAESTNHDFLESLRNLALTRQGKVPRPVDYQNLGAEQLGGVYESLLALSPQISADGARFTFDEFAGSERKTSGSFSTPDSLVQCLLDSALDPVVKERLEDAKRMANRGIGRREVGSREVGGDEDKLVSRPGGVAEFDGVGGAALSDNEKLSEGRAVRNDFTNQAGGGVHTGQYRGGLGERRNEGIHPVAPSGAREPQGTRNPSHPQQKSRPGAGSSGKSASFTMRGSRQEDPFPDWFLAAQAEVAPDSLPPYSLLAEKALLSLKVCDPAVGSGHFPVGAAHRLARHLARVRAHALGESEPSPLLYQHALCDVIGHCLYGVDINPMAAELCRVSLWLEALEPGKPLSFLDHHIRVGTSLLGTTPELLAKGIPDEAFTAIEGDDKSHTAALKKLNKTERNQMSPPIGCRRRSALR